MKPLQLYLICIFFSIAFVSHGQDTIRSVTPQQVVIMLKENPNIIILDTRSAREFVLGHIRNAINLDETDVDFLEGLDRLDKNVPYIVYSNTGDINSVALYYMKQNGSTKIYNLKGGFKGWIEKDLPTER